MPLAIWMIAVASSGIFLPGCSSPVVGTEAKIQLMATALRAREQGDLITAQKAVVELVKGPIEFGVDVVVVERARYVPHVGDQPVEHVGIRLAAGESLDRLLRRIAEFLMGVI